jgi:hypothetical protein
MWGIVRCLPLQTSALKIFSSRKQDSSFSFNDFIQTIPSSGYRCSSERIRWGSDAYSGAYDNCHTCTFTVQITCPHFAVNAIDKRVQDPPLTGLLPILGKDLIQCLSPSTRDLMATRPTTLPSAHTQRQQVIFLDYRSSRKTINLGLRTSLC